MTNISNILVCAYNKSAAEELSERWKNKKIITPSELQQNVINAVHNTKENIITGAVAGSGKTSLLIALLQSIESVNSKLKVEILNIHKIATQGKVMLAAIGKYKHYPVFNTRQKYFKVIGTVEKGMYKEFYDNLSDYAKEKGYKIPNIFELRNSIFKLIDLVRVELIDYRDEKEIDKLCLKHGIDISNNSCQKKILNFISDLMDLNISKLTSGKIAEKEKKVDYTDLLYMPVYMNQHYGVNHNFKFDLIVVDECQDLSKCQLELIKLCSHEKTRYLFVGDPYQAIYGFAGADTNSFNRIKEDLNCTYYPLSVNYRCPKSVLDLAKKYCPDIQPCDNAPNGIVNEIKDEEVYIHVEPQQMVLCRLTAPLVKCAIQCLKLKKAAKIKGKDIGEKMADTLKQIESIEGFKYNEFFSYCDFYFNARIEKVRDYSNAEDIISQLNDEKEVLEICYSEFFMADSIEALSNEIKNIFNDEDSLITLQTIHRAKGSEAEVIYILNYDKMPFCFSNATDEQYQQEINLTYVALTRCKFNKDNKNSGILYLGYEDKKK